MEILILLFLAILPVIICLGLLLRKDKIHPEPKSKLAAAFFGGILSLILTLIFTTIFDIQPQTWGLDPLLEGVSCAFLEAAIPEELFKFICLYFIIWKSKEFDEYLDGIIYATFVSMGFASIENIVYIFENGMGTAFLRAFTAIPGHFFCGVIMGYFLSLAKFDKANRISNLWKALGFAILVHGIYDSLIFVSAGFLENDSILLILFGFALVIIFIIFNVKLWKYGIKRINEHEAKDRALDKQTGVLMDADQHEPTHRV